jgi:hypothetical protein
MALLKFPSLLTAVSQISGSNHRAYLQRYGYRDINDFIDECGQITVATWRRTWRRDFGQNDIFSKGTGVSALFYLWFWLFHVSNKWGVSLESYLTKVWKQFRYQDFQVGRGFLATHKGAQAGKKILDSLLERTIPDLENVPETIAYRYGESEEPSLLKRLENSFHPSNWKPFDDCFIRDEETSSGVYLIVYLDKKLQMIRFYNGQASDLRQRLTSHLGEEEREDVKPLFYWRLQIGTKLDRAEQLMFHLIPRDLRETSRHPEPCSLCRRLGG